MTIRKKLIWAVDVVVATYACVALLNYAQTRNLRWELAENSRPYLEKSHTNNYQSTIDAYKLMVAYSPNDAALRKRLGDAYYNHAQYEKAAAAYKEALRLNPSDYETGLNLGHLYVAMNRLDEAREAVETARRSAPNNMPVENALKDLRARELYARFLSEYLDNPRTAYLAAMLYLSEYSGKDDAIDHYLKRWIADFEERVPPSQRPLKMPIGIETGIQRIENE